MKRYKIPSWGFDVKETGARTGSRALVIHRNVKNRMSACVASFILIYFKCTGDASWQVGRCEYVP